MGTLLGMTSSLDRRVAFFLWTHHCPPHLPASGIGCRPFGSLAVSSCVRTCVNRDWRQGSSSPLRAPGLSGVADGAGSLVWAEPGLGGA